MNKAVNSVANLFAQMAEDIDTIHAQLKQVTAERDAARRAAAAWKRSAKMWRRFLLNYFGVFRLNRLQWLGVRND